jgi:hypothetical protein
MPVVLRIAGFRFVIRFAPREHGPAHVHVFRSGGEAVLELSDPPVLRESHGMSLHDAQTALSLTRAHRTRLLTAWERIHEG